MLVLTRRFFKGWSLENEIIITVPPSETPTVVQINLLEFLRGKARIGLTAPPAVSIHRADAVIKKE